MTAATFQMRRLIGRMHRLWDGLSDGVATLLCMMAGIAVALVAAWLGLEAYTALADPRLDR